MKKTIFTLLICCLSLTISNNSRNAIKNTVTPVNKQIYIKGPHLIHCYNPESGLWYWYTSR